MRSAWVGVVPLLVVAAALLNVRRPANLRLRFDADRLVVELRGWDVLYCCRRTLEIPVAQAAGVGVYDRTSVPAQGLRLPGLSIPGVIRAGSYGTGAARDFWDVRKGAQVLVIQLRPGASYRRIVLEVDDPHAELLRLRPALGPLDWSPALTADV